jgi:hypothetical protein
MIEIRRYFAHDESMLALVNILGIIAGIGFVSVAIYKTWKFGQRIYGSSLKATMKRDSIVRARWSWIYARHPDLFYMFTIREFCKSFAGVAIMLMLIVTAALDKGGSSASTLDLPRMSEFASPLIASIVQQLLISIFMTAATLPILWVYLHARRVSKLRLRLYWRKRILR